MPKIINWTSQMNALLGTMPDKEVAAQLGLCETTVRHHRQELGIPASRPQVRWSPEMNDLLGIMFDREVAVELGISCGAVQQQRRTLGIPPWREQMIPEWTPEMEALLGTMSDRKAADKLGLRSGVSRRRRELGISSYQEQNRILPRGISCYDLNAKRIYNAKRKHQRLELLDTLTYEQWFFACKWFADCCAYCGAPEFLTEDHLVPISEDGPRTALNIIPSCSSCNSSKSITQAHLWIYKHFGMTEGKKIVGRIVAYLTEVKRRLS